MVHHFVMWKLKDSAEGKTKKENIQLFVDKFATLKNKISELQNIYVGTNMEIAPESNFDVILTTQFKTFSDLDIYQNHPDHVEIVYWVKKVVDQRVAIDFEK